MSEIVNKKVLSDQLAERTGLKKNQALEAVNCVFELIIENMSEGRNVELSSFGKFEIREKNARIGVNPKTGEKIEIAASKSPAFKPAKALKDAVK